MERLAEKGFATICVSVAEWLHYCDYVVKKGFGDYKLSIMGKLNFMIKKRFMVRYEKRIKSILSRSRLVHPEPLDIEVII